MNTFLFAWAYNVRLNKCLRENVGHIITQSDYDMFIKTGNLSHVDTRTIYDLARDCYINFKKEVVDMEYNTSSFTPFKEISIILGLAGRYDKFGKRNI